MNDTIQSLHPDALDGSDAMAAKERGVLCKAVPAAVALLT
jgi:hypothetical protein